MKDSNREAFEIEFSKIKSDISFWVNTWDEDMQGYNHPVMCWIWHIWQAAKAQAVPEGFVLVPKKATKKMLDAGYEAHDGFFSNGAVQDVYVAMIEAQEQKG